MVQIRQMKVPPRPVAPPDLGDTRWRRFVDAILFRRGLRQRLTMARDEIYAAYLEVEAANDRRTEGASAAHTGMFRIESLGVLESDVRVTNSRERIERTADVEIVEYNKALIDAADEREVVSFQGQAYIVEDIKVADRYGEGPFLQAGPIEVRLRGVILNGR